MAHFAKIDTNNIVIEVIVIPDSEESNGHQFINYTLGLPGRWIQTSYNGNIRGDFAGVGSYYSESDDLFIEPPPKPWYVLDDKGYWVSPVGLHPDTGLPLTEEQWDYLAVAFSLRPKFPPNMGSFPVSSGDEANKYMQGIV